MMEEKTTPWINEAKEISDSSWKKLARTDRPNKHEQALLDVLRNKLCDAADENLHPEDQYGILRDTLKDLLAPELFEAYEGALEGFVCADKYNARAKR